jgi:hypothetical protein
MPNIVEFFAHLSRDQAALDAFQANPKRTMIDFGLTGPQIGFIEAANNQDVGSDAVGALEQQIRSEYPPSEKMTVLSMTTKIKYVATTYGTTETTDAANR